MLDTSRCYLGQERFGRLLAMLPDDPARRIVGIDEHLAGHRAGLRAAPCMASVPWFVCHGEGSWIFAMGISTFPSRCSAFHLPGQRVTGYRLSCGGDHGWRGCGTPCTPELPCTRRHGDGVGGRTGRGAPAQDWASPTGCAMRFARGWQVQDTAGGRAWKPLTEGRHAVSPPVVCGPGRWLGGSTCRRSACAASRTAS